MKETSCRSLGYLLQTRPSSKIRPLALSLSHHRRHLRADLGSQAHTAQHHLVIFPTCYS